MTIRILMADDHAIVREGVGMLLSAQADMTVIATTADGEETVRWVKQERPDVAVLDIAMPKLNGIEATLQIRQVAPETRIVILSMYSSIELIYRALQAGAQGYILKEAAGTEVIDAVRAVHSGRRYLSQGISEMLVDEYVKRQCASGPASPLERLSEQERRVLQLVVEGRSSAEIAMLLSLSPKTVETYRSRLMHKLGVHSLPALIRFAIQSGISPID